MLDPVVRLQRGDKAAFRELVEEHQAKIRGLVAYMGLRPSDVDDVAQDTFLHAYEHIREFRAGTNFQAWLKRIARFKAMAFLEAARREARNRGRALEVFLLRAAEQTGETGDDSLMDRLMKCLGGLEAKARSLLEKRYSGVPVAQIARETGRSEDAAKMQLFRIRVALKQCVEAGT